SRARRRSASTATTAVPATAFVPYRVSSHATATQATNQPPTTPAPARRGRLTLTPAAPNRGEEVDTALIVAAGPMRRRPAPGFLRMAVARGWSRILAKRHGRGTGRDARANEERAVRTARRR